jgi:hypothetical protein
MRAKTGPEQDDSMETLAEKLSQFKDPVADREPESRADTKDLRPLGAALLNLALELWVEETGKTKVDLARESGLWKVYMDADGWERTQTLDRYLDLLTLPSRPRWRQVTRTVSFVLAAIEKSARCDELGQLYDQFAGANER